MTLRAFSHIAFTTVKFLLGGCIPIVALAPVVAASHIPTGMSLVWSDEFDGSSLDGTKWGYRGLGPRNDAINVPESVSVSNGVVRITTFTQDGIHYTGMIGTQDTFEEIYGYWEARIRFSSSPGQWSAFWLQSPTYGTPIGDPSAAGMEIDIIEHRAQNRNGRDLSTSSHSALHWDGYGESHQSESKTTAGAVDASDDYHTYAVFWQPGSYIFLVDGLPVWRSSTAPTSQRSEYVILSSEVRTDSWAGNIPADGYGALANSSTFMDVDYVRVYQYRVPALPGDYNGDNSVDAADYTVWRDNVGTTGLIAYAPGDGDGDGDVTTADYDVWKQQFGRTLTDSDASSAVRSPVPEPTGADLLKVGLIGTWLYASTWSLRGR